MQYGEKGKHDWQDHKKQPEKASTKFLYKAHSFYNSFLNLVPPENRKKYARRGFQDPAFISSFTL